MMMMLSQLLLTSLLVLVAVSCQASTLPSEYRLLETTDSFVDCEVRTVLVKVTNEEGHSSDVTNHRCISDDDGMVYDLPEWLLIKYETQFESASTTYLRIHHGSRAVFAQNATSMIQDQKNLRTRTSSSSLVLQDDLILANEDDAMVEVSNTPFEQPNNNRQRRTAASIVPPTTGYSSVLLVRVTTNDASVSLNANTMSERVFGSYTGTVKSTYKDCSFGKLNFRKATGSRIPSNGVVELYLPHVTMAGSSITALENVITTALVNQIGSVSHIHHVAYAIPSGSIYSATFQTWFAYAYVGSQNSFYNDKEFGYLSNLVHEFGHNLGLGHSGDAGLSYGDGSGIMGYGYVEVNGPIMCFNAPKNWQLGWYNDKSTSVSVASGAWNGRLYGYPDYKAAPGNVLIQVGNIYIQYNRISTINAGTKEMGDQVAITRSPHTRDNAKSVALAGIDLANSAYTINKFSGNQGLIIEVCDKAQLSNGLIYFDLSIRLTNQASRCGQPASAASPRTPAPTPSPTPSPTSRPTPSPTLRPTVAAVQAPVPIPSASPTHAPTAAPSPPPTTAAPVRTPTSNPSSELICDDNNLARFAVNDETNGVISKGCLWLAARPEWQEKLCVETHVAFILCEETCGSCTDNCEDSDETFHHKGVDRPCSWLYIRAHVQEEVCVPGHEAMDVCQETCNVCDGAP